MMYQNSKINEYTTFPSIIIEGKQNMSQNIYRGQADILFALDKDNISKRWLFINFAIFVHHYYQLAW